MIQRHFGRRLVMLAAGLAMLGAILGSSAATPRASAQACCWPWQTSFTGYGGWWGNGGGYAWPGYNNWWGYNNYSPYSSYGYGYSPYSSYGYGYSPYSSYGYGGYSPYFNYGYGSSYSPVYASPGMGSNYFIPSSSTWAVNPPGVAVTNPPQQYPFPTTIVGGLLGYQAYSISGQYCKDASGGMVYVNAGSPITSGVTCPGQTTSGSSTYVPSLVGAQYSVAPISTTTFVYP